MDGEAAGRQVPFLEAANVAHLFVGHPLLASDFRGVEAPADEHAGPVPLPGTLQRQRDGWEGLHVAGV